MLRNLLNKVVGDPNEKEIARIQPIVDEISALEPEMQRLSDEELRAYTDTFRNKLEAETGHLRQELAALQEELSQADDPSDIDRLKRKVERMDQDLREIEEDVLEEILPQAFAVVREAAVRTVGMRHYDVQMIGGVVLHHGRIAEMKTGEGKTLVATLPLYLNSLTGTGRASGHAQRLSVQIWRAVDGADLPFSRASAPPSSRAGRAIRTRPPSSTIPIIPTRMIASAICAPSPVAKPIRPIFSTAPTTNSALITCATTWCSDIRQVSAARVELRHRRRDRQHPHRRSPHTAHHLRARPRNPATTTANLRNWCHACRPKRITRVDEKDRIVTLTEDGLTKMERWAGIPEDESLYDADYAEMAPYLDNALRASVLFKRDKDYIVQNGEVIIVDEFTGRLMHGRRYSEGLHQAIEAKEGVQVRRENLTMATITFQNFFRMYRKLAGMTGTAATEKEEFFRIYNLDVVAIPTNVPVVRNDDPDQVYKSQSAKFKAAMDEIEAAYERGQPVSGRHQRHRNLGICVHAAQAARHRA